MVIDSSALVAILLREPEADRFTAAIIATPRRLVGTPSLLEAAMVAVGRLGPAGRGLVDRLIGSIAADVTPFIAGQASRAIEAFLLRQRPAPGGAEFRRLLQLCPGGGNRAAAAVQGR
jgi:ribonuclease VapC